ncbi:protein suppressor of variegation 3-7 [Scaptodrosophila lebanonensis]|uniref:Protein suppressor of variegation 3-7 n=1 Tax=Drosophila lebanonensis TaxID=7225 RepID=A0A6J2T238_DROLE|nr:protein suppressor of variegation 3-7 [Scaptodrosophila lebanonensis]
MSFSENTSDSDWKEAKIKVEQQISTKRTTSSGNQSSSNGKQKYSQKFCEKWLSLFDPWLKRSADDPDKPFCRACQCRLDCNRCHLMRHERTTKHKRNIEALITKGEGAVCLELSVRQERSKYYHRKRMRALKKSMSDEEAPEPYEEVVTATAEITEPKVVHKIEQPFRLVQSEPNHSLPPMETKQETATATLNSSSISKRSAATTNAEGLKLLMQIHQDKNELMESFRELMGGQLSQTPPKEKNHIDLFFESVSSSVKALSPKLIAEAKMRVSQLICELELRGLKEESTNAVVPGTSQGHNALKHTLNGELSTPQPDQRFDTLT